MLPAAFYNLPALDPNFGDPKTPPEGPTKFENTEIMAATVPDLEEAPGEVRVGMIVFASPTAVQDSVKFSKTKTEAFTLADRLDKIDKIVTVTRLHPDTLHSWAKTIRELIIMTDTAAVITPCEIREQCGERTLTLWSNYWVTKFKEAAPSDYNFNSDLPPLAILTSMVSSITDRSAIRINTIAANFWALRAKSDQSLSSFLKLLDSRMTSYQQHFTMNQESQTAFRAVLSYNFSLLRPELALRCDNYSLDEMVAELRKWAGREAPST